MEAQSEQKILFSERWGGVNAKHSLIMVLKELYLCNSIDELDHMSLLSKDINKKSIDQ